MLGRRQHDWLMGNLAKSGVHWQTLAQQVMVMDLDRAPGPERTENLDSWAGYRAPRERLLTGVRERRLRNVVVLTGDEHQNYAGEVHIDGRRPDKQPVAVEFVATSISSGGDGQDQRPETAAIQAVNPQLKYNDDRRGFLMCDVTRERWLTDYVTLDKVSEPRAETKFRARWVVEPGSTRLTRA